MHTKRTATAASRSTASPLIAESMKKRRSCGFAS